MEVREITEVLLRLYEEERTQARKCEEHRAATTNIVLVIASALFGFVSQRGFTVDSLPVTMLLVILGAYGALTSQKYYERQQLHINRARAWRRQIATLYPSLQIEQIQASADAEHYQSYRRLAKIRLYTLWLLLHLAISIAGIVLSLATLAHILSGMIIK